MAVERMPATVRRASISTATHGIAPIPFCPHAVIGDGFGKYGK